MENRVKQKKFVSLVLYLHNTQNEVAPFFQKVLPVFRDNFTNFEIVCVNDACTDGTIGVLKEYLEENHCSEMVNIIHMSFFHGLESAMNAGRDLAIGDFIYEFDTAYVDYPSELIMEVYDKLLEGNDIVSAGTRDHVRMTSGIFYFCYNKTSRGRGKIGPETFRIVSRRAINRIKSIGQYIPYRKAVYSNCGLNTAVMNYRSLEKGKRKKQYAGERLSLAFDSFIYFTNAMETVSAVICGIFLLLSVGMGIFVAKDLIFHNAVVEGWISTMSFMALGFFGVFALLTIILKYLSVMLNLIFKKQRYLIMDIEKVVKG